MLWGLALTLVTGLGALIAFIYAARKGHFENIEDAKYQMFRNDEEKVERQ